MVVVGVDGCKKGWVCACWDTEQGTLGLSVYATFTEVLAAFEHADAIGIDIPIGLIENRRTCDVEARTVLMKRKPSVFPAPDPRVIGISDYHLANARSKILSGKGISAQAFGIYGKVAEVDALMTAALQQRVVEVHPEICFWAMNDFREISPSKKSGPGYLARRTLLQAILRLSSLAEWEAIDKGIKGAASDDILDAIAATWSAGRWAEGIAARFPSSSAEVDASGLRAEIVY